MANSIILSRLCVLASIASTLLFSACGEESSSGKEVLGEGKMIDVLTDVHLTEGARTGTYIIGDTLNIATYYAKIFDKHQVSRAEFERSFAYYSVRPETMNALYDSVIERLNKLEMDVVRWQKKEAPPISDSARNALEERVLKDFGERQFGKSDQ